MNIIILGLYAEGSTDNAFLSLIIKRTAERLFKEHNSPSVDTEVVVSIISKDRNIEKRDQCILSAARTAVDCHALIIHCDADHPTPEKALKERYTPGYELVQQAEEMVCQILIPIIPIRMTEGWMLAAEHDLLREVLRTDMQARELGLINKVKQVENIADPKQTLKDIMLKVATKRSRRHRDTSLSSLYTTLGNSISLDRLSQVPSYKQFCQDLTTTLKSLNLLQ